MTSPTDTDSYYNQHRLCPLCKGDGVSQTCIGFIRLPGKPHPADMNKAKCKCGWTGVVDQMVAA